jgi:ZIP family zinc transporter
MLLCCTGIAVACPIYAATGSRWRSIAWATASGLTEPVGALVAVALRPVLNESMLDGALCIVGGIMITVSAVELMPQAVEHSRSAALWGALSGALTMLMALFALAQLEGPARA